MYFLKKILLFFLITLFFSSIFITYYKLTENSRQFLTVAFLDVGQGDAIFIEAPNGNQILIDSGQTSAAARQVSKILPFYDRQINLAIATHQDSDHIGGFPEIFKKYKIKKYATGSNRFGESLFEEIEKIIETQKINKLFLFAGDKIILDQKNNIYLDILWPPEEEQFSDTNDASVVANLIFENVSFVLTGDASKSIEEKISIARFFEIKKTAQDLATNPAANTITNPAQNLEQNSGTISTQNLEQNFIEKTTPKTLSEIIKQIVILKVGHHGSKTSTSPIFLEKIKPQYAIISAGKDNKFGHPHAEVISNLENFSENHNQQLQILETAKMGTIIFKSDGKKVWLQK
ncbi:MAG TPA: MBL fold metallo-hydrolase [Candidatus Paceibacterota bacterium]|nr:MBL fold metallo-hydrolase [Candidatus Paceibacterota bacterium]HMP19027.1 MBL fold metallo-hydrolase [Candidatus Paceibacterota bacterium]HMP85465.1 MBL fold metallo-hydrolase [Candidatus Paceibacterota bacterium]